MQFSEIVDLLLEALGAVPFALQCYGHLLEILVHALLEGENDTKH